MVIKRRQSFLFAAVLLLTSLGTGVWAAQSFSSIRIPYQGNLELNGVSIDSPHDFRVSLYANETTASFLWQEEHLNIAVSQGKFALLLGDQTALNESLWDSTSLYLGLEVKAAGDASYVTLSGRQHLGTIPFAARAERAEGAEDFAVAGALGVSGTTTTGGFKLTGTDLLVDNSTRREGAGGTSRRALVHDVGDSLTINYGADYTGGVNLRGNVTAGGNLTVNGTLNQGCRSGFWPVADGRLCMSDTLYGPDNMHDGSAAGPGAIADCRTRIAGLSMRVCTFTDFQQACGEGFAAANGQVTWFGGLAGDDAFMYVEASYADCRDNMSTGPASAFNGIASYRCCY